MTPPAFVLRIGDFFARVKGIASRIRNFFSRIPISLTSRVWMWLFFVIVALIFAQSLRMPASYMTFVFVLLMPIGSFLQILFARLFINTATRAEIDTVEKHAPFTFTAIASNNCVFPFAFIEAELLIPDERGAKCVPELIGFSLSPLGSFELAENVKFAFRGVYSVGLSSLYVYDCFRAVRLRIDCERLCEVFVLPRRFELPPKELAAESDQSTRTVVRRSGSDNTEPSDLRAYLAGDTPKSIHWKLSSKSEELIVRDWSRNTGSSVYIICDLEPHYKTAPGAQLFRPIADYDDVIDNLNSDMAVEHALAAAMRELRVMNTVKLLWLTEKQVPFMSKTEIAASSCDITTPGDFEAAFRSFATAPLIETKNQATLLTSLIRDTAGSSLIIVTSCLDASALEEYTRIFAAYRSLGAKAVELIYVSDPSLYIEDESARISEGERIGALSRFTQITRGEVIS